MPRISETYEYHRQLEPLSVFIRRQRKAILIIGCAFCALVVAAVFLIDPAFFYPRLQTDPLNYWLKAKQLIEHGNTAARWAVNLRPFAYAAMPGILRAPALLLSSEFDTQLRIIQLMNVPLLAGLAIMFAYILSWSQPERRHPACIAFAFGVILLTPVWMTNVFLPLVDAPYAFFTLASLLLARAIICSDRRLRDQKLYVALFGVFFVISFTLRFTAPAVILFAGVLARGRWSRGNISRRLAVVATASAVALVTVLVLFNQNAIFGRYLREPIFFLLRASKPAMLLNLLGVALPSQIIPAFPLGFTRPVIEKHYAIHFAESPRDAIWLVAGILISLVIISGAWNVRRKMLPELLYIAVPLPVLALMLPSTTRYVMTYQPFLWLFFYYGLGAIFAKLHLKRTIIVRNRKAVGVLAVVAVCLVIGLRMFRSAGTSGPQAVAVRVTGMPAYVSDVSRTFRNLRHYLDTLPRDSVLLVGQWGTNGRWSAIEGFHYYAADSLLPEVARRIPVYVLAECGTQETCQDPREFGLYVRYDIEKWGSFIYKPEFMYVTPHANAQVYRIFPL